MESYDHLYVLCAALTFELISHIQTPSAETALTHLQYYQHNTLAILPTQHTFNTTNTKHLQYYQHNTLAILPTQHTCNTTDTTHLQYYKHKTLAILPTQHTDKTNKHKMTENVQTHTNFVQYESTYQHRM